jgi:hypothetical protein
MTNLIPVQNGSSESLSVEAILEQKLNDTVITEICNVTNGRFPKN